MSVTWVLIANGRRARFFERDPHKADFGELADFIYPYGIAAHQTGLGSSRVDHGRTAHGGKQVEAKTNSSHRSHRNFALQLAGFINQGITDHRCDTVALIATDHMLGELRKLLNEGAAERLRCSVAADLTRLRGSELQNRIRDALTLPV
jgi:protein required for attachment to host cells